MNRSVGPTLKRLVATQAVRRSAPAAANAMRASPPLVGSNSMSNGDRNQRRSDSETNLQRNASSDSNADNNNVSSDYYQTSSFETALDQVLRLKLDCPSHSPNSHHRSLESCVRDFFKV